MSVPWSHLLVCECAAAAGCCVLVRVYRGWRITAEAWIRDWALSIFNAASESAPHAGMDLNDAVFFDMRESCTCHWCSSCCFDPAVDLCVLSAGRPVGAFVRGEPGRFIGSPLSFLRPWHTHALRGREGGSLKGTRNCTNTFIHWILGRILMVQMFLLCLVRATGISGTMRSAPKNRTSTSWQSTAPPYRRKEWVRNTHTHTHTLTLKHFGATWLDSRGLWSLSAVLVFLF